MPHDDSANLRRLFASDNAAGIHPAVLEAIVAANCGHSLAYGNDPWTARAIDLMRQTFGKELDVAFAFGGTGANIVGLATLLESWQSIVCAESSHLWRDECAAPERWLGAKLTPLPTCDGKLRPGDVEPLLEDRGFVHRAQPRVVSVSQPTEWGTVYTLDELRALGEFCVCNDLFLHVDGARLANAAAALNVSLRETSVDCGVDVLSFGGTKNGLLAGEAILAFSAARSRGLQFQLKQGAQLASKMRFVAAQFEALLSNELWRKNALHANAMAAQLGELMQPIDGVQIVQPIETNVVFAQVPPASAAALRERFAIPVWRAEGPVLRLMTSFDTTSDDLRELIAVLAGDGGAISESKRRG